MTHQTFKICVICDNNIENFYIKHFIDDFSPTWMTFTNKIYQRNPKLNKNPNLKIYWIDDENDEIIVSCEEDFRVYAEHGAHRKLYFSVRSEVVEKPVEAVVVESESQTASGSGLGSGKDNKDDETTETDDVNERKKRISKKKEFKLKLRHEREKRACSKKDDDEARKIRQQQIEEEINRKILEKQHKYLERHQKRCEKVRRMFQTVMDPANLTSTVSNEDVPPTTTAPPAPNQSSNSSVDNSQIYPHSDQIKQLTSAIANVLQPCNLINKILGEVIGNLIPVPQVQPIATTTTTTTSTATNTQNQETTPATPVNSDESGPASSHLGVTVAQNEDLIRKITESCNEIINSQNLVQNALQNLQQQSSTSTSQQDLTQSVSQAVLQNEEVIKKISESTNNLIDSQNIVKNILESMNGSQSTVLTTSSSDSASTQIEMEIIPVPGEMTVDEKVDEESLLIITPTPTSMRSRESSIEVQEFISNSDEGDRDWTFVSTGDSFSKSDSPKGKYTGAIPKGISLAESSEDEMDEVQVPVKVPVQAPVQPEVKKMDVDLRPVLVVPTKSTTTVTDSASLLEAERGASSLANLNASRASVSSQTNVVAQAQATQTQTATTPIATAPIAPVGGAAAMGPAVIVYDPNPKINRAVHAMVEMGYSNEGNWLTQLMINVDGDVSKALAFLTPNK